MHDITRDFLVSLAAFAAIFGIAYLFFTTRHRERMTMLEKGITPPSFGKKGNTGSLTLKVGMLCVGLSLGIFGGTLLHRHDILDRAPAFFAMTFLFGGLSLILNYVIDKNYNR